MGTPQDELNDRIIQLSNNSHYGVFQSPYTDFERQLVNRLDAWFEWNHTVTGVISIDMGVTLEQIAASAVSYKNIEFMLQNYNLKRPDVKIDIIYFQTRFNIDTPRLLVSISPIK